MSIVPIAEIKIEERQHALLSASSSSRWLKCTPSARLEERFPEVSTEYAEEGRLAHEIAELKLKKIYTDPMGTRKYNSEMKKLQENPLYKEEMQGYTNDYADYIAGIVHSFDSQPYVALEKRIDYSNYAPEGFGTGDCIIIGCKTLHVIDFKYGAGVPVSADKNTQMMLYALGAYETYSLLYDIQNVKMAIFQPRLDSLSEYELSIGALLGWGISIKEPAQMAFDGKGEYVPGDHCGFCRANAICSKRTKYFIELEEHEFAEPPILNNKQVGEILIKAQNLVRWVKKLEDYALSECLKGNEIDGWKSVEGRSNRAFIDIDKAFETLKANGIDEVMLYERKPITLTATEQLIGKKKFNELLTDYVDKPPGKPTLALVSDKRQAVTNQTSAEEAFREPIENTNNISGGNENGK